MLKLGVFVGIPLPITYVVLTNSQQIESTIYIFVLAVVVLATILSVSYDKYRA